MMTAFRRQRGFTMVELIIVVAIIAVLAAIALVAFSRWKRKAIRSEVASVLGAISLRQETYRSEASRYLSCPTATPALGTGEPILKPFTKPACWTDLGLTTDAQLYCSYKIFGGAANSWSYTDASGTSLGNLSSGDQAAFGGTQPTMAWYLARAECDLDGDPSVNTILFRTQTGGMMGEQNPDR